MGAAGGGSRLGSYNYTPRAGRAQSAAPGRVFPATEGEGRLGAMAEPDFDILLRDDSFLVVNKPAGLATQAPAEFDSLERRLRRWLAQPDGDPSPAYLGVPHRLDRPASGAIYFALTPRAARQLSRQFERRQVRKRYWALVEGQVRPAEGSWTDFVRKVYGQPRAVVVEPDRPGAQAAILHYRTLAGDARSTWLEIELETGRTHQIRLQAASRGHAVLGDAFYGATEPFGPPCADERLRPIALHARHLGFRHPNSQAPVAVTAPVGALWRESGLLAEVNWSATAGETPS